MKEKYIIYFLCGKNRLEKFFENFGLKKYCIIKKKIMQEKLENLWTRIFWKNSEKKTAMPKFQKSGKYIIYFSD
jgi:hypothetical protein